MTSTSFKCPHLGGHAFQSNSHEPAPPAAGRGVAMQDAQGNPYTHDAETRRMKAYAGQSTFQTPVADDFSRSLVESGLYPVDDSKALGRAGVFDGLKTWLRRQRWN